MNEAEADQEGQLGQDCKKIQLDKNCEEIKLYKDCKEIKLDQNCKERNSKIWQKISRFLA